VCAIIKLRDVKPSPKDKLNINTMLKNYNVIKNTLMRRNRPQGLFIGVVAY